MSTFEEARARADRIKEAFDLAYELLATAFEEQDYIALGYASWQEYLKGEFSKSTLKLADIAERKQAVKRLAEARDAEGAGMSNETIANTLGVSERTVRRDTEHRQMPELNRPAKVRGRDGKVRPSSIRTIDDDGNDVTEHVSHVERVEKVRKEQHLKDSIDILPYTIETFQSRVNFVMQMVQEDVQNVKLVSLEDLDSALDKLDELRKNFSKQIDQLRRVNNEVFSHSSRAQAGSPCESEDSREAKVLPLRKASS